MEFAFCFSLNLFPFSFLEGIEEGERVRAWSLNEFTETRQGLLLNLMKTVKVGRSISNPLLLGNYIFEKPPNGCLQVENATITINKPEIMAPCRDAMCLKFSQKRQHYSQDQKVCQLHQHIHTSSMAMRFNSPLPQIFVSFDINPDVAISSGVT